MASLTVFMNQAMTEWKSSQEHVILYSPDFPQILLLLKVLCGKDLRCESPGVFAPERSRPDDDDDADDDDDDGGGDHHWWWCRYLCPRKDQASCQPLPFPPTNLRDTSAGGQRLESNAGYHFDETLTAIHVNCKRFFTCSSNFAAHLIGFTSSSCQWNMLYPHPHGIPTLCMPLFVWFQLNLFAAQLPSLNAIILSHSKTSFVNWFCEYDTKIWRYEKSTCQEASFV